VTLPPRARNGVVDVHPTLTGDPFDPNEPPEPAINDLERAVDSIVLMKNLSELAVDLAYGSVLSTTRRSPKRCRTWRSRSTRSSRGSKRGPSGPLRRPTTPSCCAGPIHLGVATEEISDAALSDMRDIGVHPVVEMAVQESDEIITRTVIVEGSNLDGTRIENGIPATDISTSVIAIRRPDEGWLVGHDIDTTLRAGDAVLSKGTRTSAEEFEALAA